MKTPRKIPLKFKFLGVLIFTLFLGFTTFFGMAYRTFSEDKKLFVMDLNQSILRTAVSDTRADLKSRIDELQTFLPKVFEINANLSANLFRELSLQNLSQELLGVRFYRRNIADGSLKFMKELKNNELLDLRSLPDTTLEQIDKNSPAPLKSFSFASGTLLFNRSIALSTSSGIQNLSVLTFLIPGSFVNDSTQSVIIVVDLIQDFLRKKLSQSELAEVFLVTKSGQLLSHPSNEVLAKNTGKTFEHPLTEKLKTRPLPRESSEVKIKNETYLCNVSESEIPETFVISQIKKSEAFIALNNLMKQTLLTAIFILAISLFLSIVFSNHLTTNIKKLAKAADEIGSGNLNPELHINSNDEVKNVSDSILLMTSRIKELISEREEKAKVEARMEEELKTAQLIQSTLLSSSKVQTDAAEIEPFYLSASECGGDIWDAFLTGNILTVIVGDATGHGAPAAIVTAVAKSCFSTLNTVYLDSPLTPDRFLEKLNQVIFESCKGKLLMTMTVIQINLHTGDTVLSNAGHEAPLLLHPGPQNSSSSKCESLFVRGERLGFALESKFENINLTLSLGDTLLVYTDGVSEAVNSQNKQFGERAIKKLFNRIGTESLPDIKTTLYKELKAFIGSARQLDDITYVVLRWNKKMDQVILPYEKEPHLNLGSSGSQLHLAAETSETAAPSQVLFTERSFDDVDEFEIRGEQLYLNDISIPPPEVRPSITKIETPPLASEWALNPELLHEDSKLSDKIQPLTESNPLYINDKEQSIIPLDETSLQQKMSKSNLKELAKKTDFADEDIDTHYSRIEEQNNPDSGTSGGEAA